MFSLFNVRAKTNHIDSTRPAPLSMNEFTTEYWNHLLTFRSLKYQNLWDKTKALVLLKKRNK